MSGIIACVPVSCAPFHDPTPQENTILSKMVERAKAYQERDLRPSDEECKEYHLLRFLRNNNHDIEVAMRVWEEWVKWRHDKEVDHITEEDIKDEIESNIAVWRGQDKAGRLCLVVTGRKFHPEKRKGTYKSFKKFLIKTVEDGLRLADEMKREEICILYDRRGLEFKNIDPTLQQHCRILVDDMKVILRPFLAFVPSGHRLIVVETPDALTPYFDSEDLKLFSVDEEEQEVVTDSTTNAAILSSSGDVIVRS